MARFDVYLNSGSHRNTTPYLLDVQSDLLDGLDSRMVIPLRDIEHFAKVKIPTRLMPVLRIHEKDYLLETPKMASIPNRALKSASCSLAGQQDLITSALDFLFQGY